MALTLPPDVACPSNAPSDPKKKSGKGKPGLKKSAKFGTSYKCGKVWIRIIKKAFIIGGNEILVLAQEALLRGQA